MLLNLPGRDIRSMLGAMMNTTQSARLTQSGLEWV